jgi:hypothetical protein
MSMNQAGKLTAVITVQSILPPAGGMVSFKIVTHDGNEFFVYRDRVHLLRIGGKYQVTYAPRVAEDGQVYNNVSMVRHLGPYRAAVPADDAGVDTDAASVIPLPGREATTTPPLPVPNSRAITHPSDSERMFVCCLADSFIRTGRIGDQVDDMVSLIEKLRDTWARTFAAG